MPQSTPPAASSVDDSVDANSAASSDDSGANSTADDLTATTSNGAVNIRRATEADLPALLSLADALVEWDCQFDPSLDPAYNRSADGIAWMREAISADDAIVLVAERTATADAGNLHANPIADTGTNSGSVIAMLFGRLEAAEPWRNTGGLLAEVEMLCVHPSARNLGVGKNLIAAFTAWARKHDARRLWVRVSAENIRARQFYERELFQNYDIILERQLP